MLRRTSCEIAREVGRLAPAAVGEQHEDQREPHRRAGRIGRRRRGRAGREPQSGDHHGDDRAERQRGQRELEALALRQAEQIHQRQDRERERGMDGRAPRAERDELLRVVAEHERDRGDDAGLQDGDARPGEQQADRPAERARQEVILAAARGIGGAELGIDQRADQRDQAADDPEHDECGFAGDALRHELRALEDADADDDADDERDALQHRNAGARRLLPVRVGHGTLEWLGGVPRAVSRLRH